MHNCKYYNLQLWKTISELSSPTVCRTLMMVKMVQAIYLPSLKDKLKADVGQPIETASQYRPQKGQGS